jgi:type I restriction enzyme, R subunit
MNEAETRAELIDPKLLQAGWGNDGALVRREYPISPGKIEIGGKRKNPKKADYVLFYKEKILAVIEAKRDDEEVGEGVAQAKNYAKKLQVQHTYSTNGNEIYHIDLFTGKENLIKSFPTPKELFNITFKENNEWVDKFDSIQFEEVADKKVYYYQENAVNNCLKKIAKKDKRILLTLATGTGKTFIAFQIVWKLYHSKWNLNFDGRRHPKILFLTDRNFLADQALNDFSGFKQDMLVRIKPDEITKKGSVPTNGNIFFTIFQTFMRGEKGSFNFGEYPKDFFDLIIIDECHRGGADNESTWREILEYFENSVQIGLTATPRRESENLDTYEYFGEPVYIYSLKEGINDGYLTPFKLNQYSSTLDNYIYSAEDEVLKGEIQEGKIYKENEFNVSIRIKEREEKRVDVFLEKINQNEKTLVFCANQKHAALIRDIINQKKLSNDIDYCHRVTADDGALGESHLKNFQDNENLIPTILTTSRKLSTGVNARNIRNIVLLRPVRTMVEFKQIIGRGTRIFDNKDFFTIHDFVKSYEHFNDKDWDGEPINPEPDNKERPDTPTEPEEKRKRPERVDVKLADGKKRLIQFLSTTSYLNNAGNPVSSEEYLKELYDYLPNFFKNEDDLRSEWKNPISRKKLLNGLEKKGFGKNNLKEIQNIILKDDCDVFDVLAYVGFKSNTKTLKERSKLAREIIKDKYSNEKLDFIEFLLNQYEMGGVFELDLDNLPDLVTLKYGSIYDAKQKLGAIEEIKNTYSDFQEYLYK